MGASFLTLINLFRKPPEWFKGLDFTWRRLALISFISSIFIESLLLSSFLFLEFDKSLLFDFEAIGIITYCFIQSLVTDIRLRKADGITLFVSSILIFLLLSLPIQFLLLVILIFLLAYLFISSDGAAFTVLLVSYVGFFASELLLIVVTVASFSIMLALGLFLSFKKLKKEDIPMTPIILGVTLIGSLILLAVDIAL